MDSSNINDDIRVFSNDNQDDMKRLGTNHGVRVVIRKISKETSKSQRRDAGDTSSQEASVNLP